MVNARSARRMPRAVLACLLVPAIVSAREAAPVAEHVSIAATQRYVSRYLPRQARRCDWVVVVSADFCGSCVRDAAVRFHAAFGRRHPRAVLVLASRGRAREGLRAALREQGSFTTEEHGAFAPLCPSACLGLAVRLAHGRVTGTRVLRAAADVERLE